MKKLISIIAFAFSLTSFGATVSFDNSTKLTSPADIRLRAGSIIEVPVALSGTAIDWSAGGKRTRTMAGDEVYTFSNLSSGQTVSVYLDSAGHTPTFPAYPTVTWLGVSDKTVQPTASASGVDVWVFEDIAGTVYGVLIPAIASGGGGTTIYSGDGTLAGDRVVDGNHSLFFNGPRITTFFDADTITDALNDYGELNTWYYELTGDWSTLSGFIGMDFEMSDNGITTNAMVTVIGFEIDNDVPSTGVGPTANTGSVGILGQARGDGSQTVGVYGFANSNSGSLSIGVLGRSGNDPTNSIGVYGKATTVGGYFHTKNGGILPVWDSAALVAEDSVGLPIQLWKSNDVIVATMANDGTFSGLHIPVIFTGTTNIGNLATSLVISLGHTMPDTNYVPSISFIGSALSAAVTPSYSATTTTQFTVNLSVGIAGGENLRWSVISNQ